MPADILFEIFSLLAGTDRLRCRQVHTAWKGCIDSREFTEWFFPGKRGRSLSLMVKSLGRFKVKGLDLYRCSLGESEESRSLICKLIPLHLKSLKLVGNCLSSDDTATLLGQLSTLTTLDLSDNFYGYQSAAALSSLVNLTDLNLHFNHIATGQISYITRMTRLESLDVSCNCLLSSDVEEVCRLTGLRKLNLRSNGFSDLACNNLTRLRCLTYLNLKDNKISEHVYRFVHSQLGYIKVLEIDRYSLP